VTLYRDYDTQNNYGDGILHSDTVTQERISQGTQKCGRYTAKLPLSH